MTEIDWVTKLFSCSPATVFEELKLQVKKDVEIRNGMRSRLADFDFQLIANGRNFTVVLNQSSGGEHKSVTFQLTDSGISVGNNTKGKMFDAILTLNDCGECVPKIDGKECAFWQMRQKALEDLFIIR